MPLNAAPEHVSVWPGLGVPLMTGLAVRCGGTAGTVTAALVAWALPLVLVPPTPHASWCVASAAVTSYVRPAAPGIPAPSRSHWYVKRGLPVQAPSSHVTVWPTAAVPVTVGLPATGAPGTASAALVELAEPPLLVAV